MWCQERFQELQVSTLYSVLIAAGLLGCVLYAAVASPTASEPGFVSLPRKAACFAEGNANYSRCEFREICYNARTNFFVDGNLQMPIEYPTSGFLYVTPREHVYDVPCSRFSVSRSHPTSETISHISSAILICPLTSSHYGHILMETVLPAYKLLEKFNYNTENLTMVYNSHWQPITDLTRQLLDLLGPRRHISMIELDKQPNHTFCFQNLLVGAGRNGLFGPEITPGDFLRFRDHVVFHVLGMQSPPFNRFAIGIVGRRTNRHMVNAVEVEQEVATAFQHRAITTIYFEDHSPREQALLVSRLFGLIGASGTGMHNAIWLPDGSFYFDIVNSHIHYANGYVCAAELTRKCSTVKGFVVASNSSHDRGADYAVDIGDLRRALNVTAAWYKDQCARHHFPHCPPP
ncbi:hypothetical protein DFJ74DRAFT_152375 [Hyaloraphidium curvatum]|nr:hypothetical protein DFJ74DRAFT_152375 [Hyaloraphidium curvatum]